MNKTKNIILLVSFALLFGLAFFVYKLYNNQNKTIQPIKNISFEHSDDDYVDTFAFSDGLPTPDSVIMYNPDEFGMGPVEKKIYNIDINQDGIKDKITKTFIETGNAHSYYEYTTEIKKDNKYINITPDNLKTTNGESCDLQQIQFVFKPQFKIKVIYRELGDFWNQPTVAKQVDFTLSDNKWIKTNEKKLKSVCDVKELF